jgi:hypothetical protein
MNELLGESGSKAYHEELKLFGFVKVYPPELTHTITFTHTKLTWDDESNSYYYVGKVGIGSMGKVQINRVVDAYIEVFKKRSGDIMDVYLKLDDNNWFYFGYTRGVMQIISSEEKLNDHIRKLPNKDRQMDVASGQTPYIYMVASDAKWTNFRRQYQSRLQKLEMPADNIPKNPKAAPAKTAPAKSTPTPVKKPQDTKPAPAKTETPKSPASKTSVGGKAPETKAPAPKTPDMQQQAPKDEVKQPPAEAKPPVKKEEPKEEEDDAPVQEIQ